MTAPGSLAARLAALLGALLLPLAGCDATSQLAQPDDPEPKVSAEPDAPAPPAPSGLGRFYRQRVDWSPCGEGFECGQVEVPLDYDDPGGETIELELKRRLADSENVLGSLVVNPGGPGASGVEYVEQAAAQFGADLLDHYHMVGFDPRGVGGSSPVDCVGDAELDEFIGADPAPDDPAEVRELFEQGRTLGQGCVALSGDLAGHVSTPEVARDLDVIRAALGEPRLDYFGASYGTLIGAAYAELFPRRVGRMVLDGAKDPSLDDEQATLDQAAAFQQATEAYLAHCVAQEDCPLGDSVEQAGRNLRAFLDRLDARPIPGDGERQLTVGWATIGIWLALYAEELWPLLDQALTAAIEDGDGSLLLRMADAYVSRVGPGYANNSVEALYAVNCLDATSAGTVEDVREAMPAFEAASPIFGETFAWGTVGCVDWPVEPDEKLPAIDAAGAGPIVVIGTTGDPATPYHWAKSLAEQLESGVLVTREGAGHTGYAMGNECVDRAVEDFLLAGTVPQDGLRC